MSKLRENSSQAVNFFFLLDIFTCTLGIMILVTLLLTLQQKPGRTVVLPPGKLTAEEEISFLTNVTTSLTQSNAWLRGEIGKAEGLPELWKQTNIYRGLTRNYLLFIAKTNALTKEVAVTSRMIIDMVAAMGLTDASGRIDRLSTQLTNTAAAIGYYEQANRRLRERIDHAKAHPITKWLARTDKPPIVVIVSRGQATVELFNAPGSQSALSSDTSDADFIENLARFRPTTNFVVFLVRPSGISLFNRLYEAARRSGYDIGSDAVDEDLDLAFSGRD